MNHKGIPFPDILQDTHKGVFITELKYLAPAQLMDQVAPLGPVYQAGTLSGNPLAMAAGLATLNELDQSDVSDRSDPNAPELSSC